MHSPAWPWLQNAAWLQNLSVPHKYSAEQLQKPMSKEKPKPVHSLQMILHKQVTAAGLTEPTTTQGQVAASCSIRVGAIRLLQLFWKQDVEDTGRQRAACKSALQHRVSRTESTNGKDLQCAHTPGWHPQAALYARLKAGGVGQAELHEVRYPLCCSIVACTSSAVLHLAEAHRQAAPAGMRTLPSLGQALIKHAIRPACQRVDQQLCQHAALPCTGGQLCSKRTL